MQPMSGYLEKKGGMRTNWLRRWCEIGNDGVLRYYHFDSKSPQSHTGRPQGLGVSVKGEIDLRSAQEIRLSTAPSATRTEIEIETKDRTWRFRAPSLGTSQSRGNNISIV